MQALREVIERECPQPLTFRRDDIVYDFQPVRFEQD